MYQEVCYEICSRIQQDLKMRFLFLNEKFITANKTSSLVVKNFIMWESQELIEELFVTNLQELLQKN